MHHEAAAAEMNGLYSALYTPFDSNDEINFSRVEELIRFQLQQGLSGFFVCGTTGEGLLLKSEERIALVKHVVDFCRAESKAMAFQPKVIAHVGHPSTDVATQFATASAEAGAHWIASVAPIYYGTTFEGAMRHYGQISSATDLPFMIYSLGGVIEPNRDQAFFDLPNVCGLKYTGGNFYSVQQLVRFVDRPIAVMSGFDEQFVAGQSFGFQGGIGTTYNFGPQFYSGIYNHYHDGNISEAARLQAEINKVTHLMVSHENRSYQKAIMKYIGFDCGPMRAPYAPLNSGEYDDFAAALGQLNVLKRNAGSAPISVT